MTEHGWDPDTVPRLKSTNRRISARVGGVAWGAGDEGGGDSSSGPAHLLLGRVLARRSLDGGVQVPGGPVEPVLLGAVAAS